MMWLRLGAWRIHLGGMKSPKHSFKVFTERSPRQVELMERMRKVQAAESGWAQEALSLALSVSGWNSLFREIRGSG